MPRLSSSASSANSTLRRACADDRYGLGLADLDAIADYIAIDNEDAAKAVVHLTHRWRRTAGAAATRTACPPSDL